MHNTIALPAGRVLAILAAIQILGFPTGRAATTNSPALGEAVEATNLTWNVSGSPGWTTETNETRDGVDAVRSGAIGNSASSTIETTIQGPGTLSFWWKVSCETNDDRLRFYVNGSEKARISGEVDWHRRTSRLPNGSVALKWTYSKDSSTTRGLDRGWLDELRFHAHETFPAPEDIAEAIRRANNYYIRTTTFQSNGWARGVYQTGNMRAYSVLQESNHLQWALQWANHFSWKGGFRGATNADGQVCGQTYLDLYLLDPRPERIAAIKAGVDDRLAASAVDDWWWIDAIYMAGPVYARFSKLFSTNAYLDKMWLLYHDMKIRRGLFSPAHRLWYRDELAKTAETDNGEREFWARGNGWVLAALARILEELPPEHPHHREYAGMLRTMAAGIKPLQGSDGMWRASLLDSDEVPNPETSSTALFAYALASGIRQGLLSGNDYLPVVARAWNGMEAIALHPSGKVGFSQPQGRLPASANFDTSNDHGTGVFLLAASEIYLLAQDALARSARQLRITATTGNTVSVTWEATPGKVYEISSKNDLGEPAWIPLSTNTPGSSPTGLFSEPAQGSPQRYYRVIERD